MKVRNMTGRTGKPVANQFIIETEGGYYFQSYNSIIAKKAGSTVELDQDCWDYSVTTSKYLGKFLGMPMAAVRQAVNDGEFELVDLNGD